MANVLPTTGGAQLSKKQLREREYYQKNRDKIRMQQSAYGKLHREERNAQARKRLSNKRDEINAYNRAYRKSVRLEVLEAYGNKCECCGEPEEAFLEAHHKDGGGNRHRRAIGGGAKMYIWLRQRNFPKNFGLLCSNCNKAEYNRGICPHRLKQLGGEVN